MRTVVLRVLVALCAGCVWVSLSCAQDLPGPQTPNSHRAHASALSASTKATFAHLLARYDEEAQRQPGDVVTAVERCRFLESARPGEDQDDELGIYALLEACSEDLRQRFPHDPQAWLFRAEQSYGEERASLIREALSDRPVMAIAEEGARLRLMLAQQLASEGDHAEAARVARAAWNADPRLDVGLILARDAQERGARGEAVSWLVRDLERTEPAYELLTKARLLADLEAFGPAERALSLHRARVPDRHDELLRGRILEGLGRLAEARDAYAKLQGGFQSREARRRWFEMELVRGTTAQAATAYERLRDGGFEADPLLRQRLRLLLAHPGAPWHARDAWSFLALMAVLCGIACVPFVLLLPVHYVGLILREQGHRYESASGFTLWRAAKLFGLVLATQVFVGYLIAAENLESWFQDRPAWAQPPALSDSVQAQLLVLGMAAQLLVILCYLRLPELKRAFAWKSESAPGETPIFSLVFKTIGLLILIAAGNAMLIRILGIDLAKLDAAIAPVTTQSMLSALLVKYGPYPVIMVAAIFAPITEELLFRYALTDALQGYLPHRWANPAQALAFALCHDAWPMWPTLFCIGLFAGRLRHQTNDLTSSFLLHGAWNLMVVFAMLSKLPS